MKKKLHLIAILGICLCQCFLSVQIFAQISSEPRFSFTDGFPKTVKRINMENQNAYFLQAEGEDIAVYIDKGDRTFFRNTSAEAAVVGGSLWYDDGKTADEYALYSFSLNLGKEDMKEGNYVNLNLNKQSPFSNDFRLLSGTYVDGIYYAIAYKINGQSLDMEYVKYNTSTWTVISRQTQQGNIYDSPGLLSHDPATRSTAYGLSLNSADQYILIKYDLETGTGEAVAEIHNEDTMQPLKVAFFAVNKESRLMGLGLDGWMYWIDKDTGGAYRSFNFSKDSQFIPAEYPDMHGALWIDNVLYWSGMINSGIEGMYFDTNYKCVFTWSDEGSKVSRGIFTLSPYVMNGLFKVDEAFYWGPSGISAESLTDKNPVYATANAIKIKDIVNEKVSVFTVDGKNIYNAVITAPVEIPVASKGIYIVKVGDQTFKLVVK